MSSFLSFCFLLILLCPARVLSQTVSLKDAPDLRLNTFTPEHIALSPDNRQMAVASQDSREIRFIDVERKEVVAELKSFLTESGRKEMFDSGRIRGFCYSKDGSKFFVYLNSGIHCFLLAFDLSSRALIRTFTAGVDRVLQVSANENYVLIQRNDGILELYDFRSGLKMKSFKPAPEIQKAKGLMISPDERHLVAFDRKDKIYFLSLFAEELETLQIPYEGVYPKKLESLQFSQSGRYFFTYGKAELLIWETASKKIIRTISLKRLSRDDDLTIKSPHLRWSGDQYITGLSYADGDKKYCKLFCVDAGKGKLRWATKPLYPETEFGDVKIYDLKLNASGTKAYFTREGSRDIWEVDIYGKHSPAVRNLLEDYVSSIGTFTSGGSELYLKREPGENVYKWDLDRGIYGGIFTKTNLINAKISVSQDDSRLIVQGTKPELFSLYFVDDYYKELKMSFYEALFNMPRVIQEFDLKTGRELTQKSTPDHTSNFTNRFGASAQDGSLAFYSHTLSNTYGQTLVMAVLFGSANDFVVYTPDGHFDGTERGIEKLLRVVEDGQYVSMEKYRDQYHVPGLLWKFAFPGKKKVPASPPAIQVAFSKKWIYQITFRNTGGGLGPVEMYVGNRLIEEDVRTLISTDAAEVADEQEVSFVLDISRYPLDLSSDQHIRITAYDKGKNIKSEYNLSIKSDQD